MLKKSKYLILLLFASAGFSSLIFQVVWQRQLSIIFGGAIHSTAVILSSYMAGLALGSVLLGSTVFAMLLGHWYLVERRLSNAPMVRVAWIGVAGVVGVVLTLTSPLVLVNLTRGYPDLTATMLVGVAILLATLAEDAAKHGFEGWRVSLLLSGCGLATGWSVEVRETAVFAWPVIGWILLRMGRPRRTLLWFGLPVLAWLLLDLG